MFDSTQAQQGVIDGSVATGTIGLNLGAILLGVEPMIQLLILVGTLTLVAGRLWLMYKDIKDRSKKRNRRASDRKKDE